MAVRCGVGTDRDVAIATTAMSADLFDILVCPVDKHDLDLTDQTLACPECGRRYAIADGIPNMLVDDDR